MILRQEKVESDTQHSPGHAGEETLKEAPARVVIDTGETNEQCQFYQDKIATYDPLLDHKRTAHALLLG